MKLIEAMKTRHSVRSYTDKRIEGDTLEQLRQIISDCNQESGLNIQLSVNEPKAFSGMMARYGKITNVKNYIVLAGKKNDRFDEDCGYYGEKIVLRAQQLGLNTCWVALTYSKGKTDVVLKNGEKVLMVIAVGYGENAGNTRKTKSVEALSRVDRDMPEWFRRGIKAVQLAPTAMNQQKFTFALNGNRVKASPGSGFYTKVDLGIAKYHFELGAGSGDWTWG